MTIKSDKSDFKIRGGLWNGKTLWNLYEKAQTPFEWHKELFDYDKNLRITCFSTSFDETAVRKIIKAIVIKKISFHFIS